MKKINFIIVLIIAIIFCINVAQARDFDYFFDLYKDKTSANILDMLVSAYGHTGEEKCLKEIVLKYSYDNIEAFMNDDEATKVKYLSEWMANKNVANDASEDERESRVASIRKEQSDISESIYRKNVAIEETEKGKDKIRKAKLYSKNSIHRLIKENNSIKDDICEILDSSWSYFLDDLTYYDLTEKEQRYFDAWYAEECLYEGTRIPDRIMDAANQDMDLATEIWAEIPKSLKNNLRNSYVQTWYALILRDNSIEARGWVW